MKKRIGNKLQKWKLRPNYRQVFRLKPDMKND
jgi:hypothetical protein